MSLLRNNLAILASKLPSYDDIKSTVISNHFFQPFKTLLFNDWPQDQIYPASVDDFVRRIYDTRLSLFDTIFGKPRVELFPPPTDKKSMYIYQLLNGNNNDIISTLFRLPEKLERIRW